LNNRVLHIENILTSKWYLLSACIYMVFYDIICTGGK
jgi:hypothetical protein